MKQTITQLFGVFRSCRRIAIAIVVVSIAMTVVGCDSKEPLEEVRERLAAGDVSGSLDLIRELIAADQENPELLFLYGRLLSQTGQPGPAEWSLRKAMRDPTWFESAALLLATNAMNARNFETAVQLFDQILEANPDDLNVRLMRANACAASPLLTQEALAEVDRILEISPDEVRAYKPRILAYLTLEKPDEARQALEELGARLDEIEDGDEMRGWHCATMAIFAADSGDDALAHERWAGCEEKYPGHPNVVEQSIQFHKDRGEMDRALEVAGNAFAADPSQKSGYRMIYADLLRSQGREDEAEALLKEMLEMEGGNPAAAWLALTRHYQEVGDLEAAVDSLEHGLALAQKAWGPQPDLLFALADLMIQVGRDDDALELTQRMTVPAHRALVRARVAHERKRYASALELYKEAMRLWPENTYAAYHAGRAAMAFGNFDLALENFMDSIRIAGETDARVQAARIMAEEGRWVPALTILSGAAAQTDGVNVDSVLLRVEIVARFKGQAFGLQSAQKLGERHPTIYGRAIEVAADGAGRRGGAESAWKTVEPVFSLELPPVNRLPILRAAVKWAPGDEELALVKPLVLKAVKSQPQAAAPREVEGMFFERTGAPKKAEASYRLALEAEPERPTTLLRLARLVAATDPQGAIELIDHTLTEEGFDAGLFLAAISALDDAPGVEPLMVTALELDPTDGRIAFRLAELLERRGGEDARVLRLANRALRFQVGSEATALRDRVRQRLEPAAS